MIMVIIVSIVEFNLGNVWDGKFIIDIFLYNWYEFVCSDLW